MRYPSHSTCVEVALDPQSKIGTVLKTLGRLLGLDSWVLRGMIRQAIRRELGAEMMGVRLTTAAFTPGTEGKKENRVLSPRTMRTHGS